MTRLIPEVGEVFNGYIPDKMQVHKITVGSDTTADRFFSDTTINPASSGAVLITSTGLTVPYVYDAAQDFKVTVAGATVAAGLCNVYIQYAIIEN